MQIILLDKVSNLGSLGDRVNVRGGYARNFLIPKGKAVPASRKNIEHFEARRVELEAKLADLLETANSRAEKINNLFSVTISAKAGEEGKLFGSIRARDVASAVSKAGIQVNKNEIRFPNGIIRSIGEHEVTFHLHSDVLAKLVIRVVPE